MDRKELKDFNFTGIGDSIEVYQGDLKYALKLFKTRTKQSRKLLDLYEKKHYQKPSEKKRALKDRAIYREKFLK